MMTGLNGLSLRLCVTLTLKSLILLFLDASINTFNSSNVSVIQERHLKSSDVSNAKEV